MVYWGRVKKCQNLIFYAKYHPNLSLFFLFKNTNLILHPSLENSTTRTTIMEMEEHIDQLTCNAHSWAYALIKIIVKGQLLSLALQFILFSFITWPNLINSTLSSDWICHVLKGAVHKLCCLGRGVGGWGRERGGVKKIPETEKLCSLEIAILFKTLNAQFSNVCKKLVNILNFYVKALVG